MVVVSKFGGGVLCSKSDFERAAELIAVDERNKVVVVSALNGVTDQLLQLASDFNEAKLSELRERHLCLYESEEARGVFLSEFNELSGLFEGVRLVGEISERTRDKILSFGERFSALALADALNARGVRARRFTSEEAGIVCRGGFGRAKCDLQETQRNLAKLDFSQVLVFTGFYAVDGREVKTLGRGGSDYSAGVIARALNASQLVLWKNVDGFYSADPHLVENAVKLDGLSWQEAEELGYFGAKIMHPRLAEVLLSSGIVCVVKNVFNPLQLGTLISGVRKEGVKSIAFKQNVVVVSVKSADMFDVPGFASELFLAVAQAGISIDVISTSQTNISFTIEENDVAKASSALADAGFVFGIEKGSLIGVVGEGVQNIDIISRIFSSLAKTGISIQMLSQGASEIDLSIIVSRSDLNQAVNAIHEELVFGEPAKLIHEVSQHGY